MFEYSRMQLNIIIDRNTVDMVVKWALVVALK